MNSRWQANKIGLINFWYYDEQEFPFVKGRMLLRGSNGSGKSVTMQSVVPRLLDGNMSPERWARGADRLSLSGFQKEGQRYLSDDRYGNPGEKREKSGQVVF